MEKSELQQSLEHILLKHIKANTSFESLDQIDQKWIKIGLDAAMEAYSAGADTLQTEVDRLESDYSSVLCHATMGNMSKTSYDLQTVYAVIDDQQAEHHYEIVKSDLNDLIDGGGTMEDVKEYADNL